MYALELKDITKVYGNGILANDHVSFKVKKGEIHALMGENGAGKSTLMKVLFGMEKPDMGEVFINEKKVLINNPVDALKNGIGMVHQHFMLTPSLTVTDNMILGCEPTKLKGLFIDRKSAVQNTLKISEKYKFTVDPNAKIKDLPVGARQQIEILKALYRGAEILILDEPTAVLAPQETEKLFEQLKLLREQGHTIVFISHKISEVIELCDRLTVMRLGKVVGTYDVHGTDENGHRDITVDEISRLMVGRDAVLEVNKTPAKPKAPVLKVKNLTQLDKDNIVKVNDVSFSVRSGEILAVAGIEGNGQRELVDAVTGMTSIDDGEITVNDDAVARRDIKYLRTKLMAYIPQDRMMSGVASGSSIEYNVVPYLLDKPEYQHAGVLKQKAMNSVADKAVAEFDVRCENAHQPVGMLSGGNIQKVVVARELSEFCRDSVPLIVADQPSRGIDIGATKFIHRKLVELRDSGAAILLISADLNEVFELADSAIVMYEGEIGAYLPDMKQIDEFELGQYMLGIKKQTPEEIGGVLHEA